MRERLKRRAARSDLPREVWVLGAIAFAVAIGFGIVAPIIPVFAREFGVGQTAAGLVISAFAFTRLVCGPWGGRLVNRYGERLVLATGMGIVAVSTLLTGLAQTFEQMLALRAVGGIGSVMFTVSAHTLLLRTVSSHQRGRASGVFSGGFLLGGVSGPFLGGVFGSISLRLPFFIYAATLVVAGAIGMAFLSRAEVGAGPASDPTSTTTLREALRHKAYQAALTANVGTGWVIFGIRSSLVPLFVVEVLRRGPLWTGIGLFVGSIAQALLIYPIGKIADTLGRRPLILAGTGGGVVGSLLLAFSANEAGFLLAMVAFGVAGACLSVGPSAVVGDVVVGRGGTVVAAYGMAADVGAVVGPLLAGALAEHVSYRAAFISTAVVMSLGVLMALRMPETVHRSRPEPEPPHEG